jgi:hypothetical protein
MNMSRMSKRTSKSNFSKKSKRPLTFAEAREQERIKEAGKIGPGSVDPYKPIGADMPKVNFGSKYEFKPDKNPGVGTYNPDPAMKHVKEKKYEAYFLSYKKPKPQLNDGPDPGAYDKHLTSFGADIKQSMTLGGKYEWKADNNPPVGGYDPNESITKPANKSAFIKPATSPYRRPKEQNPDPGLYDAHLTPFGSDVKPITMGKKYEWKPDTNPPVGGYDLERGESITKF